MAEYGPSLAWSVTLCNHLTRHTPETKVPTNEEVVKAVSEIRARGQGLGPTKLAYKLHKEYHFNVTSRRIIKLCSPESAPYRPEESLPATAKRLGIPDHAIVAQAKYVSVSGRSFMVYGHDGYNYGVSLNNDMSVVFDAVFQRLKHRTFPYTPEQRRGSRKAPRIWDYYVLWNFYVAAARRLPVTKVEIGAQFELEYNMPWRRMPLPKVEWAGAEARMLAAKFKEYSLRTKRKILREIPGAAVTVDVNGEPVWDEKKHRQYALRIFKLDKEDGKEFEQVWPRTRLSPIPEEPDCVEF